MAMPPLSGEVVTSLAILSNPAAEGDAVVDESTDSGLTLLGDKLGDITVA